MAQVSSTPKMRPGQLPLIRAFPLACASYARSSGEVGRADEYPQVGVSRPSAVGVRSADRERRNVVVSGPAAFDDEKALAAVGLFACLPFSRNTRCNHTDCKDRDWRKHHQQRQANIGATALEWASNLKQPKSPKCGRQTKPCNPRQSRNDTACSECEKGQANKKNLPQAVVTPKVENRKTLYDCPYGIADYDNNETNPKRCDYARKRAFHVSGGSLLVHRIKSLEIIGYMNERLLTGKQINSMNGNKWTLPAGPLSYSVAAGRLWGGSDRSPASERR